MAAIPTATPIGARFPDGVAEDLLAWSPRPQGRSVDRTSAAARSPPHLVLWRVSRREKLVRELLSLPTTMRFSEVALIVESHGHTHHRPRGGSSHHTFRKPGSELISIPVHDDQARRITAGTSSGNSASRRGTMMSEGIEKHLSLPYKLEVVPLSEEEGGGYYARYIDFGTSAHGDPVPEPLPGREDSGEFNVRVPKSLHKALAEEAESEGVSLSMLNVDRLGKAMRH